MATLTVWKFPDAAGADAATDTLRDLATKKLITIHDAATVSWPEGKKKPKTRQLQNLAGAGALGGAPGLTQFQQLLVVERVLGHQAGDPQRAAGAMAGQRQCER